MQCGRISFSIEEEDEEWIKVYCTDHDFHTPKLSFGQVAQFLVDFTHYYWPAYLLELDGGAETINEFVRMFTIARFLPTVQRSVQVGSAHIPHETPIFAWLHNPDNLIALAGEFVSARHMLTSKDTEEIIVMARRGEAPNYNEQSTDSFNQFVFTMVQRLVYDEHERTVLEPPFNVQMDIDIIRERGDEMTLEEAREIGARYWVEFGADSDWHIWLERLEDIRDTWAPSRWHDGRIHRLNALAVTYGPSTAVGSASEGHPALPSDVMRYGNCGYGAALYIQYEYIVEDAATGTLVSSKTCLKFQCYMPILVRSVLCALHGMPAHMQEALGEDPSEGISPMIPNNSSKRIVIGMERWCPNMWFTNKRTDASGIIYNTECRSTTTMDVEGGTTIAISQHVPSISMSSKQGAFNDRSGIYVQIPQIEEPQSLLLVMAAYGFTDRHKVAELILDGINEEKTRTAFMGYLRDTMDECTFLQTTDPETGQPPTVEQITAMARHHLAAAAKDARESNDGSVQYSARTGIASYAGGDEESHTDYLLYEIILPHIGWHNELCPDIRVPIEEVCERKVVYLTQGVQSILMLRHGYQVEDTRDFGGFKRLTTAGPLIHREFRKLQRHSFSKMEREMRECVLAHRPFSPETVHIDFSSALRHQMMDPNWSLFIGNSGSSNQKDEKSGFSGISQMLDSQNHVSKISHARVMQLPMQKTGKNIKPRQLRNTTRAKRCINGTPEGTGVGIRNELAILCRVTTTENDWPLLNFLHTLEEESFVPFSEPTEHPAVPVFLNGDIVGYTSDGTELYNQLVTLRRSGCGYHDMTLVPEVWAWPVGIPFTPKEGTHSWHFNWLYAPKAGPPPQHGEDQRRFWRGAAEAAKEHGPDATVKLFIRSFTIYTDIGRMVSPYLTMDPVTGMSHMGHYHVVEMINNPLITFRSLVNNGYLEYLNAHEEDYCQINQFPHDVLPTDILQRMELVCKPSRSAYTRPSHCSIHPCDLLGYSAGLIPEPQHSMGVRNLLASVMNKQALAHPGYFALEDFVEHAELLYPSRPPVMTAGGRAIRYDQFSGDTTLVMAVLSYKGYGTEDAIVVDERLIDMNLGSAQLNRVYTSRTTYSQNKRQRFANPEAEGAINTKMVSCEGIEKEGPEAGLPRVGQFLDGTATRRSVVIGQVTEELDEVLSAPATSAAEAPPPVDPCEQYVSTGGASFGAPVTAKKKRNRKKIPVGKDGNSFPEGYSTVKRNTSEYMRVGETGRVRRRRLVACKGFGSRAASVLVTHLHTLEFGSKLTPKVGQKGTIALTVPHENMPFCQDGTVIEMIVDPAHFSSRLTVNLFREELMAKAAVLEGRTYSASSHTSEHEFERAVRVLHDHGYHSMGSECLYNGESGELMPAHIFVAPGNFLVLRHMAAVKAAARATGPNDVLTRSATDGKSRSGGQRYGGMEIENNVVKGADSATRESLITLRGWQFVPICTKCQRMAIPGPSKDGIEGSFCKRKECAGAKVAHVMMQNPALLFFQEQAAAGVDFRFGVEEGADHTMLPNPQPPPEPIIENKPFPMAPPKPVANGCRAILSTHISNVVAGQKRSRYSVEESV